MAFTFTTDSRPHSIGDLVFLNGTFNAAGVDVGAIDLSAHISEILSATVNGDTEDNTGGGVDGAFALLTSATTLTIDCVSANTGKWSVIGSR